MMNDQIPVPEYVTKVTRRMLTGGIHNIYPTFTKGDRDPCAVMISR